MPLASQVADFFSALGDLTRIRILGLVYTQPLTNNEIKDKLGGISLQALSYQLKKLEDQNIIRYSQDPSDHRKKNYHLADKHVAHILNDTIMHIKGGIECDGELDCEDGENLKMLMVME